MYTRQEASLIRQKFWTSFGQYMRPVPGSEGETVNWINYKTGERHIFFRLNADSKSATVAIELTHPDADEREYFFNRLEEMKKIFQQVTTCQWRWEIDFTSTGGKSISRIVSKLEPANIFNEADWPALISFFKARLLELDEFWSMIKDALE